METASSRLLRFHLGPKPDINATEASGDSWHGNRPRVTEAFYTTLDGDPDKKHFDENGNPKIVRAGTVTWHQLTNIKRKTDYEHFLFARLEEGKRGVVLVTSLTKSQGEKTEE